MGIYTADIVVNTGTTYNSYLTQLLYHCAGIEKNSPKRDTAVSREVCQSYIKLQPSASSILTLTDKALTFYTLLYLVTPLAWAQQWNTEVYWILDRKNWFQSLNRRYILRAHDFICFAVVLQLIRRCSNETNSISDLRQRRHVLCRIGGVWLWDSPVDTAIVTIKRFHIVRLIDVVSVRLRPTFQRNDASYY